MLRLTFLVVFTVKLPRLYGLGGAMLKVS